MGFNFHILLIRHCVFLMERIILECRLALFFFFSWLHLITYQRLVISHTFASPDLYIAYHENLLVPLLFVAGIPW